jgi:hypothetical protein
VFISKLSCRQGEIVSQRAGIGGVYWLSINILQAAPHFHNDIILNYKQFLFRHLTNSSPDIDKVCLLGGERHAG